jgi:hypothetical protein
MAFKRPGEVVPWSAGLAFTDGPGQVACVEARGSACEQANNAGTHQSNLRFMARL